MRGDGQHEATFPHKHQATFPHAHLGEPRERADRVLLRGGAADASELDERRDPARARDERLVLAVLGERHQRACGRWMT